MSIPRTPALVFLDGIIAAGFAPFLLGAWLLARLRSAVVRLLRLRPRICFGPTPMLTIHHLARAARRAGYSAQTIVFERYANFAAMPFDVDFSRPYQLLPLRRIIPYLTFGYVLAAFDIVHTSFDLGFLRITCLRYWELPLLKWAGKKVLVSPYGSDVLQPSQVRRKYRWSSSMQIERDYPTIDEDWVRENIAHTDHYADLVFANGDFLEFIPRCDLVVPGAGIELDRLQPVYETADAVVRIIHSTNHRAVKGTDHLVRACAELQAEGEPVELVIVEGTRHEEALRTYAGADIIAAEFLSGTYGVFAVEGMALGKPVVCYLRENLFPAHPYWHDCPIVNADPDQLKEALRGLVRDPARRVELGRRGRAYVEKYYSEDYVAGDVDRMVRRIWYGAGA